MIWVGGIFTFATLIGLVYRFTYFGDEVLENGMNNDLPAVLLLLSLAFGITLMITPYRVSWRYKIYEKGIVANTYNPDGNVLEGRYGGELFVKDEGITPGMIDEVYVFREFGMGSGLKLRLKKPGDDRIYVAVLGTSPAFGRYGYWRTQACIRALKVVMGSNWEKKFRQSDRLWIGRKPRAAGTAPVWLWMTMGERKYKP